MPRDEAGVNARPRLCRQAALAAALVSVTPFLPAAQPADDQAPAPIATSSHFAFHSDFELNLNDALITAGTARIKGRPDPFHSGVPSDPNTSAPPKGSPEADCFAGLAPSARAGWSLAVDWYAEVVSPADWNDRQQVLLRFALAGLEGRDDARAGEYLGIARGFLAAAAPAYRACRWEAQDRQNRAWVEGVMARLGKHEVAIGRRLATLYQMDWHGLPMRVDMVPTAAPHGANTWILDPGGHIQISSAVKPAEALETVFHEASHTLNAPWRPDPVPAALAEAAKQAGVELPRDLWHIVLFYTTGEAIRAILEAAGEPPYTPFMDGLWSGSWAPLREPVETVWPAYLAGERTLPEAAIQLMKDAGSLDAGSR